LPGARSGDSGWYSGLISGKALGALGGCLAEGEKHELRLLAWETVRPQPFRGMMLSSP